MTVTTRSRHADTGIVQEYRLTATNIGVCCVHLKINQAQRTGLPRLRSGFAIEVLLGSAKKACHVGLQQIDLVGQLSTPAPISLFHAQTIERIQAKIGDAVGLTRRPYRRIQCGQIGHCRMQLPTQLPHIIDAQGQRGDPRNLNSLRASPGEVFIVESGIGQAAQHLAGERASHHDHTARFGAVTNLDLLAVVNLLHQMVHISELSARRREEIKVLIREPRHRGLAENTTVLGQKMRQRYAAVAPRHQIGKHPIQEGFRVGSRDIVFGKPRQVDNADPLSHGAAFFAYHGKHVVAPITTFLLAPVEGEPFRPLPTKGLGKDRALAL